MPDSVRKRGPSWFTILVAVITTITAVANVLISVSALNQYKVASLFAEQLVSCARVVDASDRIARAYAGGLIIADRRIEFLGQDGSLTPQYDVFIAEQSKLNLIGPVAVAQAANVFRETQQSAWRDARNDTDATPPLGSSHPVAVAAERLEEVCRRELSQQRSAWQTVLGLS